MGWPGAGNDPWYLRNPDENYQRRNYYGVDAIPDVFVDGVLGPNPDYNSMRSSINTRANIASPVDITLDPWFDGDFIHVEISVEADQFVGGGFIELHVALCQIHHHQQPPFPNGQTDIIYPLLELGTDGGAQVDVSPDEPQEWQIDFEWLEEENWTIDNLVIIAFIQDNADREILNSASATIPSNIPLLMYHSHTIDDAGQAHPNGRPDAGETVNLIVELMDHELYLPAFGVTGILTCEDPTITITDNSGTWGDIINGETGDNSDDPFSFTVPAGYDPQYVNFILNVEDESGYEDEIEFVMMVGVPTVLFVNDYGIDTDFFNYWEIIFAEAGFVPDVMEGELVFFNDLEGYNAVIWATASDDDLQHVLNDLERISIGQYLDDGGNLILSSQFAGEAVGATQWFHDYFGVNHAIDQITPPGGIGGESSPNSPLPGVSFLMAGGGAGDNTSPSSMTLINAVSLFEYMQGDHIAGAFYNAGTFKTIYLGFPIEAISGAANTDHAAEVLNAMLGLFEGGGPGVQMVVPLRANFFNLVSTYLTPPNLDAAAVFGTIEHLEIVYQDDGDIFIPPAINTIGNIDTREGYQIFVSGTSQWEVEGEHVNTDAEYELFGRRWNWLGFPYPYEIPITMALEPIEDFVEIVQTDLGGVWIPPAINTIGNMEPGRGYFVFTQEDLNFQYPPFDLLRASSAEVIEIPQAESAPQATGLPYTIVVRLESGLRTLEPTFIEVYDHDRLVGKAMVVEQDITPVTAWGGSEEFALPGFKTGNPILIQIIGRDGAILVSQEVGYFGEGAYTTVTLDVANKSPIDFAVQQAFPNPFNPTITVPFSIPTTGEVTFMITNVLGQQVSESTRTFEAGQHQFVFAETDKLVSGVYFLSVQYGDKVVVQKMILLK